MGLKSQNESYYQYRAYCSMRKEDGSEEVSRIEVKTDIPSGNLFFWNKLYHIRKCRKKLYSIAIKDKEIVKCKILREEFILIPRFNDLTIFVQDKGWLDIRKIILVLEMILLIVFSMTQTSIISLKESGCLTQTPLLQTTKEFVYK